MRQFGKGTAMGRERRRVKAADVFEKARIWNRVRESMQGEEAAGQITGTYLPAMGRNLG